MTITGMEDGAEVITFTLLDDPDFGTPMLGGTELGEGDTLLSGFPVPFRCFGVALGDALGLMIHQAKAELGCGVAPRRRFPVPFYCLGVIPLYATTVTVHGREVFLGFGVSALRQGEPLTQRCPIVTTLVRSRTRVKTRPCGQRQQEGRNCGG